MEARKVPAVKISTQALPNYSVSDAPGLRLSYFGYEFEVPWNASFKERTVGKTLVQLKFHLALCAMRTVGDAKSLKLIEQSVGDKREGVTQYSDERNEPSWEPVRREARDAIRRRQNSR